MKKRFFAALVFTVLLMTLLPATAFAAPATSVWIWGQELTAATPYYHNEISGGQGTADANGYDANATFEPETGTLILNDLNVKNSTATTTRTVNGTSQTFTYALFADGDLKIRIINTDDVSYAYAQSNQAYLSNNAIALCVNGDLTVEPYGEGYTTELRAKVVCQQQAAPYESVQPFGISVPEDAQSFGVSADTINIKEKATLIGWVEGSTIANRVVCAGVIAETINVTSGELLGEVFGGTATGGMEENNYANSYGIYSDALNISGSYGDVTGVGGTASGNFAESYGVFTKALNFENGKVKATGGSTTGKNSGSYSHGLGVYGDSLSVSGGHLEAFGGEASVEPGGTANAYSYGITTEVDSINISDCIVEGTGGNAVDESIGIVNDGVFDYTDNEEGEYVSGGAITISDKATVTATGGEAYLSIGLWCRSDSTDPALKVFDSAKLTAESLATQGCNRSYGACTREGDIELNASEVLATGGEAVDRSYGVYMMDEEAAILVSGGKFIAKTISTTSTTKAALSKALTCGTGTTAKGSTSADGSSPVDYVAADNSSYTWVETTAPVAGPKKYSITNGANGEWIKSGTGGLGFTADGDYSKFTGVSVDGATVSSDYYTSQSGSTVVTLKPSYLETLSVGQHTLRVSFTDGYAETQFTINAAAGSSIPATGDNLQPMLWLGIALLAGAGIVAGLVIARRKRQNG